MIVVYVEVPLSGQCRCAVCRAEKRISWPLPAELAAMRLSIRFLMWQEEGFAVKEKRVGRISYHRSKLSNKVVWISVREMGQFQGR